jgi:hypothetical protein
MRRQLRFTHHAKDRFQTRFPELVVDNDPTKSIAAIIYDADEKKALLNNTRLMSQMYENHGYDEPISFFVKDDVVFVVRRETVVTVYSRKDSIFGGKSSRFNSSKVRNKD